MQIQRKYFLLALLLTMGCADANSQDPSSRGSIGEDWCSDPNTDEKFACTREGLHEANVVLDDGTTRTLTYELINGAAIFEGDIILDIRDDVDELPAVKPQGAIRTSASSRWPNKIVPWRFGSPPPPNTTAVREAIAHWEQNTELRFPQRTSQTDFVEFVAGSGCSSSIGRVGGRQRINLSSGCSRGSIIHEIGHAVGLWHEQSRSDRDQHLIVLWQNITSTNAFNFRTFVEQGRDGRNSGTFDFGSIMLYPSYAFSSNGRPTLLRRSTNSTYQANRSGLSPGDLGAVRTMYPSSTTNPTNPTTGVVFYEHANYGGAATQSLAKGSYSLAQLSGQGFVNDWTSSVRIPTGWSITVYADDNFSGTAWTLSASASDFSRTPGMNDTISSCVIR